MATTCPRCQGERVVYDATMADYVSNGGTGTVCCPACRGTGTETKLSAQELRAEFERLAARPLSANRYYRPR